MSKILEFLKGLLPSKKETPQAAAKPSTPELQVYVTLHGSKFHYDPDCPSLRNSKYYRMDLSKAKKAGRKACDKCCYSYLHD